MTLQADAPSRTKTDFAQTYAEFASNLTFSDLSAATVSAAKVNLIDTLSCSIAGFNAEGSVEVRELVGEWGGRPEVQVLWSDLRVPAPSAAWINSIMAHARDYDDVHEAAIVHLGVSNVPAALAAVEVANGPVCGEDFYAGLIAGEELTARMGVATKIGLNESGFIYSSLFGYFGATAGAARIMGMSAQEIQNSLGITYSQAAGGHQVTRDGAHTKRMQPGFGARAALTSVAMTRKGVVGPRNIFEGADGLWRIYLRDELDASALREDLGSRFHMEDLSYKPYPSCRFNHTAIDAALQLLDQPGFDWRQVTEIRAYVTEQGREVCGTPLKVRQNPKSLTEAQFSLCYNIACALVNGGVGLADFADPSALIRPEIAHVTKLVVPLVDDEMTRQWGRGVSPTRVEAVIGDKVFTARTDRAKGSSAAPFTQDDVRRKLEDSLFFGGFDPASADFFEETIDNLVHSTDVAADIRRLSAGISTAR
jgi:2-methylcitrate dehydratase PrpD